MSINSQAAFELESQIHDIKVEMANVLKEIKFHKKRIEIENITDERKTYDGLYFNMGYKYCTEIDSVKMNDSWSYFVGSISIINWFRRYYRHIEDKVVKKQRLMERLKR